MACTCHNHIYARGKKARASNSIRVKTELKLKLSGKKPEFLHDDDQPIYIHNHEVLHANIMTVYKNEKNRGDGAYLGKGRERGGRRKEGE